MRSRLATDLIANGKVVELPGVRVAHLGTQAAPLRLSRPRCKLNQVQCVLQGAGHNPKCVGIAHSF